ncbi:MAG TPA: FAD-binding oxidoreductase [Xanthomonadales bacterium]|nr:FAD-binding oxidoreductase [Xanthomonadales bacterium]
MSMLFNTAAIAANKLQQAFPGIEVSTDAAVLQSHGQDWTRFYPPAPMAVAFPRNANEVQTLVRHANSENIAIVPSGGRTGLSAGAVASKGELVISMDRMRRIVDFNPVDRSLTVEAGVVTATVQAYAREQQLFYPVSFASEGSSQIGGNVATNAGGIRVLRYGLTRDWVSGLKVVTGAGEQLELNRGLVKNASGYDLRHLFIGSEGTLGLITEVTLQLTDPPLPGKVLLLGLSDRDALMQVFALLNSRLELSAFEFLTDKAMRHVRAGHDLPAAMDADCPLYVLSEFDCPSEAEENLALECFEQGLEQGWLVDGVISQNEKQNAELWRYREGISEAITRYRPYKNDLSVRVSRVPEFLSRMDELVAGLCPDFEVVWYGHIGDGNLHMNLIGPADLPRDQFEHRCHEISEQTYALTEAMGGSISAEHGLGLLKQAWLHRVRSPGEIAVMRGLKAVLDPNGIMNPGKLLPSI